MTGLVPIAYPTHHPSVKNGNLLWSRPAPGHESWSSPVSLEKDEYDQPSLDSYLSISSVQRGSLRVRNENDHGGRDASTSLRKCDPHKHLPVPRAASSTYSRDSSTSTATPPPYNRWTFALSEGREEEMQEIDLNSSPELQSPANRPDRWREFGQHAKITPSLRHSIRSGRDDEEALALEIDTFGSAEIPSARHPFKKWVNSLRRKRTVIPSTHREPIEDDDERSESNDRSRHDKSSSVSSMAFVSAIRTASISLASVTLPLKGRRTGPPSNRRSVNRSSRSLEPDTRPSAESKAFPVTPIIDEGVRKRAVQRRRILEELISSEESYIGDMKILVNVSAHACLGWRSCTSDSGRSTLPFWPPSRIFLSRFASRSRGTSWRSSSCTRSSLESFTESFPTPSTVKINLSREVRPAVRDTGPGALWTPFLK